VAQPGQVVPLESPSFTSRPVLRGGASVTTFYQSAVTHMPQPVPSGCLGCENRSTGATALSFDAAVFV